MADRQPNRSMTLLTYLLTHLNARSGIDRAHGARPIKAKPNMGHADGGTDDIRVSAGMGSLPYTPSLRPKSE